MDCCEHYHLLVKKSLIFHFSEKQTGDNTFCSIWAASWQIQQNDLCTQRRLRSAWAFAQSDQNLRCALNGYPRTQCFFRWTAKTVIRLGGCPGWSFCWFYHAAAHLILVHNIWKGPLNMMPGINLVNVNISVYSSYCQNSVNILRKMWQTLSNMQDYISITEGLSLKVWDHFLYSNTLSYLQQTATAFLAL